ncbi:MAG: alkaline phosphatase family protein, partial [Hymenobacter sp.]
MKSFLTTLTLSLALAAPALAQPAKHVVLISIDGFRPDFYREAKWPTPNLQRMAAQGTSADGVRGVFPSVTYPSHTTLVTGVAPAQHGIYYNSPFEP